MSAIIGSTNITLDNTSEVNIPATPLAGQTVIYPKADKLLYYKDDAGVERATGAPYNGTLGATTPAAATVTSINGGQLAGMRNRTINGDMQIDQRNAGAAVTLNAGAGVFFAVDRFGTGSFGANGGVLSARQSTLGISNSLKVTATTAVTTLTTTLNVWGLSYSMEGQDSFDLNSKTITLSFKVNTNWTGNLPIAFNNSAFTRSYVVDTAVTANVTKDVSVTVTLESATSVNNNNAPGLSFTIGTCNEDIYRTATTGSWIASEFYLSTSSTQWAKTINNFVNITEVQLEQGSVATPFERRPIGVELALCQRYALVQTFHVPTLKSNLGIISMRVTPTITGGGAGFASTGTTKDQLIALQTTAGDVVLILNSEI